VPRTSGPKCIEECPYGARAWDLSRKSGKDATKQSVVKCTLCQHRIDQGVVPSCVNTCPPGARIFGDLNDPNSEVSKLVKEFGLEKNRDKTTLLPAEDTVPMLFYIDPKGAVTKMVNEISLAVIFSSSRLQAPRSWPPERR
jgi:tetrathionate reductase subunit B